MTITLLQAGWVAAWDGSQHQVLERGEVAFQGDKIPYVGPGSAGRLMRSSTSRSGSSAPALST